MFGLFNRKSKKPSDFDVGRHGSGGDVYARVQHAGDWDTKHDMMQGCVAAFEEGRHENLRAFMMGYLEFKRARGAITRMETAGMDTGSVNLVAKPIALLLEKQKDPAAVLTLLTQEMSPYYKQVLLDLTLREAASNNAWMIIPVLIDAGADVNAGRGRPLSSTARLGYIKATQMLLHAGARIDLARSCAENRPQKERDMFNQTVAEAHTAIAQSQGAKETPDVPTSVTGRAVIKKHPPSNGTAP